MAGYASTSWPDATPELRTPVVCAARLWALIHVNVKRWISEDTKIRFVHIEDNLSAPERLGQGIRQATGLNVKAMEPAAIAFSKDDVAAIPAKAHVRARSAASITDYWRQALTNDELFYVNSITSDLWAQIKLDTAAPHTDEGAMTGRP